MQLLDMQLLDYYAQLQAAAAAASSTSSRMAAHGIKLT
jgi:hypothetical protein